MTRKSHGMDWLEFYAIAIYDFGLSAQMFWALTPAQYNALSQRKDQEDRQADYRAGLIASQVHNIFAKRPKQPLDFFPHWKRKKSKGGREGQSPEETRLRLRLYQAHLNRMGAKGGKSG